MKIKCSILLLLAFVLGICAIAQAARVIVAPTHLVGWSIATNKGGVGKLSPYGPSTYETNSTVLFPSGRGAFFATTEHLVGNNDTASDCTPSTVWLGLDTFNGQPLAGKTLDSITDMSYNSFCDRNPQRWEGGSTASAVEVWTKTDYWRNWQQPICLQITAESPDGQYRRQFWFRPWGSNVVGDDFRRNIGNWEYFNCMTAAKWYSPATGSWDEIAANPKCAEMPLIVPGGYYSGYPNWDALKADVQPGDDPVTMRFGLWKLVATSTTFDPANGQYKSAGWDSKTSPAGHPNSTGTGMPINFQVGARKTSVTPIFGQCETPDLKIRWFSHTYAFRGQIDNFTLGFTGMGSNTYDFEPMASDPSTQVVATTTKATVDPIAKISDTRDKNLFKIAGKVTRMSNGVSKNDFFLIDDGSGLTYQDKAAPGVNLPAPMWCFLDPPSCGDVRVGDYISVTGYVSPLIWTYVSTPPIIWSAPLKVGIFLQP